MRADGQAKAEGETADQPVRSGGGGRGRGRRERLPAAPGNDAAPAGRLGAVAAACCALLVAGCASAPPAPPRDLPDQVPHPWHGATADDEPPALPARGEDHIFVQCHVLQGNGYNWAATLGWLSSQFLFAAERAEEYEARHRGARAWIDVSCTTGSSSGGAATSLVDHLLANPAVVAPRLLTSDGGRVLTAAEAREASRALMFLALSADFSGEKLGLGVTAVGAWLGLLDRSSRGVPGRWWRAKSTPDRNLRIFGKWITAARQYEPAWFDGLVGNDALALPTLAIRPSASSAAPERLTAAAQRMEALAREARDVLEARLSREYREAVPVGDGACVTALAVPLDDGGPPFDLQDLRLLLVCNAQTYRILTEDADFASLLAPFQRTRERLMLARADRWDDLLDLTLREPDLLTPLSGRLQAPPIGLEALSAFEAGEMRAFTPEVPYLVLGGFADPRLQAWGAYALTLERLRRWRERGVAVSGRLALFGRTEDRADPAASFAQRTVVKYFTDAYRGEEDAGAARRALDAYYAWQDEFCEASAEAPPDLSLQVDHYRMDWNLTGTPAAMSRRSSELAALGFNLTKSQTPRGRYPALDAAWFDAFLFAPEDAPAYVPEAPAGGMTCR